MIFKGIQTSIAKKPYIFVIFQGVRTPCPPSGSTLAKLEALAIEDEVSFLKLSTIARTVDDQIEFSFGKQ